MRALRAPILLLCLAALAAGCAGLGGDDGEPTASEPAQTTSPDVRTAVYERSFSECSTYPMTRLAQRYDVEANVDAVSLAVARFWTRQFKGGKDAVTVGERACIQGFNDPVGNPA